MADVIYADFLTKTYHKPGEDIGDAVVRSIEAWGMHSEYTPVTVRAGDMPKVQPDYGCSDVAYVAPERDGA